MEKEQIMRKIFVIATLLIFFGPLSDISAQMRSGQLTIPFGKQRIQRRANLRVKFLAVVEDSRCPKGVNCIWAGSVTVRLRVMLPGKPPKIIELSTLDGRETFEYEGFLLKLLRVSPYPEANETIRESSYRVELEISKPTNRS
jgi:hypothetical protein